MPLPGAASRIIHPRWSEHHRAASTAMMPAACVITRATGAGTTGSDGTWTPSPGTTIYTGACWVVKLPTDEGRVRVSGEAQRTPGRYQVGIEYDTARVLLDDVVEFTDGQDAGLAGLKFRVTDVAYGSEQWEQNLLAEELQ
jgi:hypothetical protein